jgi:hypothetical protein
MKGTKMKLYVACGEVSSSKSKSGSACPIRGASMFSFCFLRSRQRAEKKKTEIYQIDFRFSISQSTGNHNIKYSTNRQKSCGSAVLLEVALSGRAPRAPFTLLALHTVYIFLDKRLKDIEIFG